MSGCESCEGDGWALDGQDDAGLRYYRPCNVCRPELYARWREGRLNDPVPARRPKRKAAAHAQRSQLAIPNVEDPPPPEGSVLPARRRDID